jgi:FkbM family methyltransferase
MGDGDQRSHVRQPRFLKRMARVAARSVYRITLPFIRPLAFRTRRYLTQLIQDELNRTSALALSLQGETTRMQQELMQEIRHSHAAGIQTLLNTAQSVQHEILMNAHRLYQETRGEAQQRHDVAQTQHQQFVAGLHQAIQHSRESLREELFRTFEPRNQELEAVIAGTQAVLETANKNLDAARSTVDTNDARLERIENYAYTSARRVAVHCDHGTVLVKTAVGYVLCDDSDHAVLASLIDAGELEPGTRLLIERFLRPGDVFVDVGANLGMISLAAAHAMRGIGQIFAFEPFAPTKTLLEKTFWLNGMSSILKSHEAAVSSREGHTRLFLGATSGHHSIFPFDVSATDTSKFVDVPVVTLDGALPAQQQITLLKIDAEGAELDVMNGALKTQATNPDMALIVEFGASHLRRVGHSPDQWLSAFSERGFKLRAIHPETGILEEWSREQLIAVDSINLFFARPTSGAWTRLGEAQ